MGHPAAKKTKTPAVLILRSAFPARVGIKKDQGSDEGAPRIPDLRQLSKKLIAKALPPSLFAKQWRIYTYCMPDANRRGVATGVATPRNSLL